MKNVLYTAIIGNYDELKLAPNHITGWDYICFTDNNNLILNNKGWDIRIIENTKDNRRTARRLKILCFEYLKNYDLSVWIDGNIQLKVTPDILIKKYGSRFTTLKHRRRDCIYKEANAVIKYGKGNANIVTNQILKYKNENFPKGYGLAATRFLIRENNIRLNSFMKLWWNEVKNGSFRDQLSFNYVCWKTGIHPEYIEDNKIIKIYGRKFNHNIREFI